jgi:hypothetical protein
MDNTRKISKGRQEVVLNNVVVVPIADVLALLEQACYEATQSFVGGRWRSGLTSEPTIDLRLPRRQRKE